MGDTAIAVKTTASQQFSRKRRLLQYYSNGALTAAATKKEWVVFAASRILDIIVDSESSAGVGNGSNRIDININGTTVFTTQANRPILTPPNTGMWTTGRPEVKHLVPGDIISIDVDAVPATSGATRTKVLIILEAR